MEGSLATHSLVLSLAVLVAAGGTAAAAENALPETGRPFPALTLPSLTDGAPLSIARFRGRKVLLHQFASW